MVNQTSQKQMYDRPDGIACDLCIFTITTKERKSRREQLPERKLELLLIKRSEQVDAFPDHFALPGGFTERDETIEEAALRELKEETNVSRPIYFKQVRAVHYPGRDPRGWIPSVLFYALLKEEDIISLKAGDDASDALFVPIDEVFDLKLAFDHEILIREALDAFQKEMLTSTVARYFLPEMFTIDQLTQVLQVVVPTYKIEKKNFIKKLVPLKNDRSVIEEVMDYQKLPDLFSNHEKMYRFKNKEMEHSIYDSLFF